MLQFGTVMK